MTFKLTDSRDGESRLNFSIDFRASLNDVAVYVTAQIGNSLRRNDSIGTRIAVVQTLKSRSGAVKIMRRCILQKRLEQLCQVVDAETGLAIVAGEQTRTRSLRASDPADPAVNMDDFARNACREIGTQKRR